MCDDQCPSLVKTHSKLTKMIERDMSTLAPKIAQKDDKIILNLEINIVMMAKYRRKWFSRWNPSIPQICLVNLLHNCPMDIPFRYSRIKNRDTRWWKIVNTQAQRVQKSHLCIPRVSIVMLTQMRENQKHKKKIPILAKKS